MLGIKKKGQDTIPIQLTTDGEPNYTFNREDEGKLEGRFGAESTHWIPCSHRFMLFVRITGKCVIYG